MRTSWMEWHGFLEADGWEVGTKSEVRKLNRLNISKNP